jgi:glycosyltransferase involved in cell wall biosynthesis
VTRIQFFGDLAATGFGTVTMDLGRAMLARGDDVRFVSLNETPGELPEPFASRTFNVGESNGWIFSPTNETEAALVQARIVGLFSGASWPDGWQPEAAIILGDFEAVRQGVMPDVLEQAHIPLLHYCPVEGVDLPPRWGAFWSKVTPVAMSEFGADQIERVTGTRPPVIYHGIDCEAFYPVSEQRPIVMPGKHSVTVLRSKNDCRRFWGGKTDRVWLFRSDRHMPRKRYSSLLRSIAPVMGTWADVDFIYHCRTSDQGGNLEDAKSKFRPDIAARMLSTGLHDQFGGIDRRALNALYNASDIYVSVSAEGFGLTIAEAMACGVPAVGIGYSSVPEVIGATVPETWSEPYVEGAGGYIVRPAGLVDNPYDHFWASVDEAAFGKAVESLVLHKKRRRELGFLASQHVERTFSWATAARQFSELAAGKIAVAA